MSVFSISDGIVIHKNFLALQVGIVIGGGNFFPGSIPGWFYWT